MIDAEGVYTPLPADLLDARTPFSPTPLSPSRRPVETMNREAFIRPVGADHAQTEERK
jgi:hypothetical protein